MRIVGLDPSFKRTGIAIFDDIEGTLEIKRVVSDPNSNKSFEQIYDDTERVSSEVAKSLLTEKNISDMYVYSECPPPQGSFSPGLYALDCMIFHKIFRIPSVVEINRLYPTFLQHMHKKRKYNKSDSVALATDLIKLQGIEYNQKFCHDEAEAVIYLFVGLADHDMLSKEVIEKYPQILDANIKSL